MHKLYEFVLFFLRLQLYSVHLISHGSGKNLWHTLFHHHVSAVTFVDLLMRVHIFVDVASACEDAEVFVLPCY